MPVEAYSTCTNFEVISDNSTRYNGPPSIFGDQVVWASEGNIVAYNLSNGVLGQITQDYWWKEDVEIFENRVVWVEYGPIAQIRGCDFELNGVDGGCLGNDSKLWITNSFSLKSDPVLFENKLVWSEYDGNDFEIVVEFSSKNDEGKKQDIRGLSGSHADAGVGNIWIRYFNFFLGQGRLLNHYHHRKD